MKKNIKYLSIILAAFFFSISSCFALEMTLDELGEKIEGKSTSYYAYIIGNYAFPGDHVLTMQDVMLAARTIDVTDQTGWSNEDDVYNEMTVAKIQAIYNDDDEITGWEVKNNLVGTSALNANKVDVDYIITKNNNYEIEEEQPEEVKHTVTFIVDGDEIDAQEVTDGETATDPGELFGINGYKFVGWYEDDEFNTEFDFNTEITKDYVLYAKYVPFVNISEILGDRMNSNALTSIEEYRVGMQASEKKIVYLVQDNDATLDKISTDGILELVNNENIDKIVITSDALDNDYEFKKGANEASTLAALKLQVAAMLQDYVGKNDITLDDIIGLNLNVKFVIAEGSVSENELSEEEYTVQITGTKLTEYSVTFNDNGNETVVKVKDGHTVSAINATNAPDGKEFDDWYTENTFDNKFNFSTAITGNIELYANYIYNPKNVTTEAGLLAMVNDTNVEEIILGDDIELANSLSITTPKSINGNGKTITLGESDAINVISINTANNDDEVNISNVTLDGNQEGRGITISKGNATLTSVNVTNGLAHDYASGVFATSSATVNIVDCVLTGNTASSNPEDTTYYKVYSKDLWIGANAKVTVTNSTVGNAFVDANEYSATNPGFLKVNSGIFDNVYVEYDGGFGGTFNYVDGTISKLMLSTTASNGTYTEPELINNTTYVAGQE